MADQRTRSPLPSPAQHIHEPKPTKADPPVDDLGAHMMRLFARSDARGVFITNSDFTSSAITECITHSTQKTMVLCTLRENVMLLMNECDLAKFICDKVRAAVIDKKPYVETIS